MNKKQTKIKKLPMFKKRISASSMLFMGLTLFLTVGFFMGLVVLQSFLLEDVTYKKIVVAKVDVPKNLIITEKNVDAYFTTKDINILDVTSGALENASEIVGQKTIVPLYANEEISLKDFEDISVYTQNITEPVEISIKIEDIADANGGKLRTGDLVNVTMMFTRAQLGMDKYKVDAYASTNNSSSLFETFTSAEKDDSDSDKERNENEIDNNNNNNISNENDWILTNKENNDSVIKNEEFADTNVKNTNKNESISSTLNQKTEKDDIQIAQIKAYEYDKWAQYVMENMYISRVLDSAGTEISSNNTEASASIIFFIIEKANEADVNNALENCSSLKISKVLNKPDIAFVDIGTNSNDVINNEFDTEKLISIEN